MNISKANAITHSGAKRLGRILADALHKCDNVDERKGVLRAREEIQDILADTSRTGRAFITEAEWKKYNAFMDSFEERLHQLEPLHMRDVALKSNLGLKSHGGNSTIGVCLNLPSRYLGWSHPIKAQTFYVGSVKRSRNNPD
jgi:hypothetical protein